MDHADSGERARCSKGVGGGEGGWYLPNAKAHGPIAPPLTQRGTQTELATTRDLLVTTSAELTLTRQELAGTVADLHEVKQYKLPTLYTAVGISDRYLAQVLSQG